MHHVALCLALVASFRAIESEATVVRLPGTYLHAKLDLPGFRVDEKALAAMRRKYADNAVTYGTVEPKGVTFSILAGRDEGEGRTSEQWREFILKQTFVGAGLFDVAGIACSEHVRDLEPPYASTSWHAFVVVGDRMLDLQMNFNSEKDKPLAKRADFEHIVAGARFALVRRGSWNELAPRTLDLMHQALARGPKDVESLRAQVASDDADAHARFALAEVARGRGSKPDELVELYRAASAKSPPIAEASAADRFEKAVALDGEGLALLDSDRAKDAVAPLRGAREILATTTSSARGPIAYDLACALARSGDKDAAFALLKEAVGFEERFRAQAAADKDFASLKDDAAFVELTRATKR